MPFNIKVKVLGILALVDDGETDWKILVIGNFTFYLFIFDVSMCYLLLTHPCLYFIEIFVYFTQIGRIDISLMINVFLYH